MNTNLTDARNRHARNPRKEAAAISILRTADVVRRHLAAIVEQHDVTLQQYNVLRILRGVHPHPLPTLEIGERLIERVPGITRLIDRLESKGFVYRVRRTEDRRVVHCGITPKALALLEGMDEEVNAADTYPVEGMAAEDVTNLVRLLEQVRAKLTH